MNNAPDVRISVFDHAGTLLKLDASADFAKFDSKYENTPTGCGAAELKLALLYEDVAARGYYSARNIVQINTGDDTLKTAITSGATKLYVNATSLAAYNNTWEPDAPEIYLYDGATLTMRIPVTGTGSDGGGNFISVGTPIAGGGNPTTIPAYAPGTVIGRRRYAGQIIKRNRPNSRLPEATISCGALTARLKEALGTFTITNAANVDIGAAIYAGINQFVARWPEFVISAGNFPTVGNIASGTWTDATVETFIRDCINQVTTGDSWSLYIGHDRVVRLIKLYTSGTNTYAYNVTLPQEVQSFEPLQFQNDDQDASALFNSFKVIGDIDPATKQPVSGIYQDATSISNYGQIDASAVTNVGIKTQAQANALAQGISNQFSVAKTNARFRIFVDEPGAGPLGLTQGDVVSGVSNVMVSGFNATGGGPNLIPDSPLAFTSGSSAQWTLVGLAPMANNGPGGVAAFNSTVGTGAAIGFEAGESVAIAVTPGQSYMLSGYIGATSVSGSALPSWSIYDTGISVEYARASAVAGSAGRFQLSAPWVCPAGVTQVRIICDTNNAVVSSGQKVTFSQPQFEPGSTASTYSPNTADSNIYGLCVSAVTTLVPGGTRYQDVQYSAIEPDWNASMQERTNALAAALMKNSKTPQAIDQYCVSIDAFPATGIPTSGLVVNPPTFYAVFAPNTAPIKFTSPTFTCLANKTNWAWLSSNGTWTVNQTDAVVTGAILFGIFMTNGTTVIGQWPKAPVGVITNGVLTTALPTAPAGAALAVSSVSLGTFAGTNGAAGYQPITFTPTVTATAPFSQWGAGYLYWMKVNDTGTSDGDTNVLNYTAAGSYAQNTTGSAITDQFGPVGAGHGWQFAIQWLDQQGKPGPLVVVAVATAQQIGSSSLQKMPGTLKTNGPTFSGTTVPTISRVDTSGSQATFQLGFTITDFGTPQPSWFQCATAYFRLGGRTFSNDGRQLAPTQLTFGSGVTSPTNLVEFSLPIGQTVEFGLSVTDLSGDESKIVWPSQWGGSAGSDPAGALIDTGDGNRGLIHGRGPRPYRANINSDSSTNASTPNLFPNSDFAIGGGTTGIGGTLGGTVPKFWGVYAGDTVTFSQDAAASPPVGLTAWKLLNSGAGAWTAGLGHGLVCGSGVTDGLQPFVLRAGTKYTVSFYAKTNEPTGATFLLNNNAGITVTAKSGFPTTVAQNVWQRFAFDIVVGGADYSGGLYPYCPTAISSGNSVWFAAPQNEEGTVLSVWSGPSYATGVTDFVLPHSNKNLGAIDSTGFDTSNNVASTTRFLSKVPNLLANMVSDVAVQFNTTTTSISGYVTSQSGAAHPSWNPGDGSAAITTSAGGTGASPLFNHTGLSPSTNYWFVIYYNKNSDTFSVTRYATVPTAANIATAWADGNFVVLATAGTSQAVGTTNSGTAAVNLPGGGGARIK